MKQARPLFRWLLVLVVLMSTAPALIPAGAAAQDDETTGGVEQYRAQIRLQRSVYGPEEGVLVHDAAIIANSTAGVDLQNFYARARFTVPYDSEEQPWDAGLNFRIGRDQSWRVVVNSEGRWFAGLGGNLTLVDGPVENLELAVGEENEIEIVADGPVAYLAINREEVAQIDISRRAVSGDIAVGTTYSDSTTNVGAEMEFSRFQIWELDPSRGLEMPAGAVALMEDGRDQADLSEPLAGPVNGALEESSESINVTLLGVETEDFYARVDVTNPRDGSEQPFDFGIGFRDTGGDEQFRLVIASDGTWYFKFGVEPPLAAEEFTGFDAADGATNVLEIAVQGDLGVFAINGNVIGALDVSAVSEPGDIAVGVGFYPVQDVVEGSVTTFADFSVWALGDISFAPSPDTDVTPVDEPTQDATAEPTDESTEEATEEPVDEPTAEPTEEPADEPVDDATAFDEAVDSTRSLPILVGPIEGELELQPDSLAFANADVDVSDFILQVEFINPYSATEGIWDYGVVFRFGEADEHYRLILVSTGEWYLSPGPNEPIASGVVEDIRTGGGQRNSITLVVMGDKGYLGVNGDFVSALDLSDISQSGDIAVGSSFFQGSFVEGAVTGYEDLVIWEVDSGDEPVDEPTEEPTDEPTEEPTDEPTDEPGPDDSTSYTSPTYGYAVRYDDSWEIVDESSEDGVDYVRFDNGTSSVDFQSFESDFTPEECVDDEFAYYQTGEGFSEAQVAIDVNDNEMRGEIDDYVWGVFWFTFTSDGEETEYTSYVECRPIDDGVLLRIVQFVPFDDYNDQIDARVALLEGLDLGGGGGVDITVDEDETPESDVTAEPEDEETPEGEDGETAIVRIEQIGNSGIEGLATIDTGVGDRSRIRLLLIDAPDGTIAIIQEGTCARLSGNPAFLLNDVQAGLSSTLIPASVEELLDGGYVITVHVSLASLDDPVACGPIARG